MVSVLNKNFDFIGVERHVRVKDGGAINIGITFYEDDRTTPINLTGRVFGAQVIDTGGNKLQDFTIDVTEYLSGKVTLVLDTTLNPVAVGRHHWECWEIVDNIYITGGHFVVETTNYV